LILGSNLLQIHIKRATEDRNTDIVIASAYTTRTPDNLPVPTKEIFTKSFAILNNPLLPLKAEEISF